MRRRAPRIIVTAVMVISALLITTEHASAVVPGKDGKIAFTRSNQVYTINANGTGVVKLTTSAKNYWPRWSPDGKRIAFVHETSTGSKDIWVMSATGANKKQVTREGTVTGAAWSPDGKWLAYGGTGSDWSSLKRIRSTAPFGAGQLLTGYGDPSDPSVREYVKVLATPTWSSNGQYLVFESLFNDSPSFYIGSYRLADGYIGLVDASGGSCCGFGRIHNPAFAANGTTLAYTHDLDEGEDPAIPQHIVMRTWPATPPYTAIPFASDPHDDQIAFAPSGTQVALMNNAAGAPTIYIAKKDGTGRRALTGGYQPDWQRVP